MASIYDNYPSTLSPLQLTTTQYFLQNQGLRVNPGLTTAVSSYESIGLISTWINMQTQANAGTGGISAANKNALANIASPTCAALGDSIPQYYLNLGTFNTLAGYPYPYVGMSGIIKTKANIYLGSPTGASNNYDYGRFAQIFTTCLAYFQLANQFIISACNSDTYLCDTFSNTDNMTTGDITSVNLATEAFGKDLANLGRLWDLSKIDDLGSPLALMQQIINVVGAIPVVSLTFIGAGVPSDVVVNLDNPDISVDESAQKLMYLAMTQITGDALTQILQLMGVTTVGITTMADLLNPVKLFPNSFQTLTVSTKNGARGIYTNSQGSVNTTLIQYLPNYVLSSSV
jgi:hypothetical protein